jgi:ATP phosphoribosyltransferase regulatory subunit
MAYYTGITFKGYAPGLGFSICSGGRYDDLVGHFGPAQPAVGCALWLDRMLLARQRQAGRSLRVRPDLLLAPGGWADGLDLVQQLRRTGLRVELVVSGWPEDQLLEHAQTRGARRIAVCSREGELMLYVNGTVRSCTVDELLLEARTWASPI